MADILNQDEVDLLLSAVSEGDVDVAEAAEEDTAADAGLATTYDFRRPERVSKEQLKGLQSLFEAFAREVSIVFPPFLRTVVRVDLTSIDQLTYDEFILSVCTPHGAFHREHVASGRERGARVESVDGVSDSRPRVGREGHDAF